MRGKLLPAHYLLIPSSLIILSCQSTPIPLPQSTLLIYRFNPPAFIEYSLDYRPIDEIPFAIPPSCGLFNTFPAPLGNFLVIELSCPNGQTVLFLDASTSLSAGSASVTQPVTASDSHFLAWTGDGTAAYLKADSLGSPHILRAYVGGRQDETDITEYAYDVSYNPAGEAITFALSRGLGFGSELYLANRDGRNETLLSADQYNYLSFARWSPDGKQIAFIKIPDTQTPFTVGELWVMDGDGSHARKLADVDAGHGYAANWSPDGGQIAFVLRENPEDDRADQSSDALVSNIYIVDVETGEIIQVTSFTEGRLETPIWSPDGNTLAFNAVVNGRMKVQVVNAGRVAPNESGGAYRDPGEILFLETESACCPVWMRK
ncbi:MAG TPA: hypothetical protein VJ022_00270 [Anaerolineales bacterium]|nr:hypothetical protein [Anaerolineales bacterium]